ncbi:MAG: long-chain fatty acid--CoA ligase [Pseudomonadota bacterium]
MQGLLMNEALTITSILRHAERQHGDREVVSVTADSPGHRTTYGEVFRRARRVGKALHAMNLAPFDRVATLAWNDHRHLELYYAISCAGFVCHTINPRLFPEQIAYIINHAEDKVLCLDPMFVPLVEALLPSIKTVDTYVLLTDSAHMPETKLPNAVCYEEWLEQAGDGYRWPDLDENAASSLCYTSGTTGNPKGVLYSHRGNVLHSYAATSADCMGLSSSDSVLPVVPMFHANAWGLNYAAPMVGAQFVLPGPKAADPETLVHLFTEEKVTLAAGVPTVWLGLLQYLRTAGITLEHLERTVVGGAACPLSVMDEFRERHGVDTYHAWGMTEMSPLGTLCKPKHGFDKLSHEEQQALRGKQGRPPFGVEMKIVGPDGTELPWDGTAFGTLKVRGPWIASGYYRLEDSDAHDDDGWFDTGDVATIDADGFMQITDRTKDVIKSGGEWISSIELENVAVGHPKVAEAAVIGVPHPKWSERPLLVVVLREGQTLDRNEMLDFMTGKVASWWLPDDVRIVDEIPHTATGKISKLTLREQLADYRFPDSSN